MTDHQPLTLATKLSSKIGQPFLFVLSLALSIVGYYAWQFVGVFVWFFTYCCGESGDWATKWMSAGCVALHIGLLSWLFRRRVLYKTWMAWALSVGLALGLFAYTELLPHH